MQSDLLTSGQAASELGVSVMTVVRWSNREDGTLTCSWTPGGHRRFLVAEVARVRARIYDTTQARPQRQAGRQAAEAES